MGETSAKRANVMLPLFDESIDVYIF